MILAALLLTLPLLERPSERPPSSPAAAGTFAVMVTGDGGWKKVDERVTVRLREEGIPVVGFIASSYFRTRRTPEETALDLERVLRFYRDKWQKPHVILIGYSRGADSLPFMVSRLPADLRESTRLVALLGLEPWIDFRFHPSWTFAHYFRREAQFEVRPEVEKLRGMNVMCVYGEKEKDSLCPALDPGFVTIVRQPGGHHFAGNYDAVGNAIFNEWARRR